MKKRKEGPTEESVSQRREGFNINGAAANLKVWKFKTLQDDRVILAYLTGRGINIKAFFLTF